MGRMKLVVCLSAVAMLLGGEAAWARHRGCGGCGHARGCHGHRHHGHGGHGGCGTGCASGCGGAACGGMYAGHYALDGTGQDGLMFAAVEAPATLVVNLPEDAELTIDNQPTVSTSATRVLTSPPLEPGKDFTYTLRAKVVRSGQTQSVSQEVIVRAGEATQVTLNIPAMTVASK